MSMKSEHDHAVNTVANTASTICSRQNEQRQLERLAAQRSLYTQAKTYFSVHALLSTVVAGALSVASTFIAELKPYATMWGLALLVLDQLWLTPTQKRLREHAATIQESFDCYVLGLSWHKLKAGRTVDDELVVERANRYRRREPSMQSLRDWYPVAVCRLPLFLARVACQRINAWWDEQQRRVYAQSLAAAVIVLILVLSVLGITQHMDIADLLQTVVLPMSSALGLVLRQYKENLDAAARLAKLKEHASDLWSSAIEGATEGDLSAQSRSLQNEIFDHRKRDPPVFDWFYWVLRNKHESEMQETASARVQDLLSARGLD